MPKYIVETESGKYEVETESSGSEGNFTEANIQEQPTAVASKPQIQEQNILGQLFNVPGATSRAAIRSNPALAMAGPFAGLAGISGLGGSQAQQAAGQGALQPDSVRTFQDQAIQAGQESFGGPSTSVAMNFAKGLPGSIAGLAADMATDPANVLLSLIPGLKPGRIQTTSQVVDKPFIKAVNPGTKGMNKHAKIEGMQARARSTVESIVDNKANLNLVNEAGEAMPGKLPENLDEFSQAISQTKKQVFTQYDNLAKTAGEQGATVPLRPIADEILNAVSSKQIEDLSPTVQNYGMQLAERLQKRGTYTLTEAQDAIEALNNKLKTYFQNPTPEALHQLVIDRAVVNHLKNGLVKSVESKGGNEYAALRRQYGALNATEESVTKAAMRNMGERSSGLGRMFDTLSSGDIVNGILTLNPAQVVKGGFQVGIRRAYAGLNNPNKMVSKMFQNVDRIKNVDPKKRALQGLLKKAAVGGMVSSTTNVGQ